MTQSPYPAIVVGTDGSETAQSAVTRAGFWASALAVEFVVVSVFRRMQPYEVGPPSVRAQMPGDTGVDTGYSEAQENARLHAASAKDAVGGALDVSISAPEGDPADVLLETAERRTGSLLALGSKGMTGSKRFLLGSVPNKISHHAVGDLVIFRTVGGKDTAATVPATMLLATDGSKTAAVAVERAVALAAAFGTRVTVLSAADDEAEAEANIAAAGEIADAAGVAWDGRAAIGDAASLIVEAAAEVDLVVVGSKGMTDASRFLLGSVPNKVSHHAPVDVLIVKTT